MRAGSCGLFAFLAMLGMSLDASGDTPLIADVRVVGTIEEVVMVPIGPEHNCPVGCFSATDSEETEYEAFCISNQCGCAETTVRIAPQYQAELGAERVVIESPVGEWCRPPFGLHSESTLYLGVNNEGIWVQSEPLEKANPLRGLVIEEAMYHGRDVIVRPVP